MLIIVCLKAGSGAPWRPQDAGDRHDQSRYKFAGCRNIHLLFLFLLFHCHLCHASFPHNAPFWTTQHNNQFGVGGVGSTALMPAGMLIITLSGRHRQLPGTLPCIFLRRTQLTTTPQCLLHVVTQMADSGRHGAPLLAPMPQWSPSMLADCCMQWCWEWGIMAAMGRRQPPRLVGHGLASFS